MFSGRHAIQTVNGRVFIDRDPQTFKMMIEFIRNHGKLTETQKNNYEGFLNELNFWGIDPNHFKIDRSGIDIAQELIDKCNLRGILQERTKSKFLKEQLEQAEPFNLIKLIDSNALNISKDANLNFTQIKLMFKDKNGKEIFITSSMLNDYDKGLCEGY